MPKGGKKGARKHCEIVSDVKLSDFANSSTPAGRLRKSVGNTFIKEAVNIKSLEEEETLWFERDLDEFQFLDITTETPKKQLRTKKALEESLNNTPGVRFPIDVWFLIGQYVKPEDVKLFASICKDSYQVSRSYSFWMEMYRRYYKPSDKLPTRLQPECIEQAFCLKSSVIRALYMMYPKFTNQLSTRISNTDVYDLSNLCCSSMWRLQVNEKWVFHFKFQNATHSSDTRMTYRVAIKDLWTNHDVDGKKQDMYVNHNPDEGCKILRFTSSHFVVVPQMVIGSRLSGVRINLAHDMRRQKLQLMFCYSNYRQSYKSLSMCKDSGSYNDIVEFDAVENLMILNWWHPQYPLDYIV